MAVAGDELANAQAQALYGRYYPNVYRYALSQLRSAEDAEDAAQNTFLRAFAALQKGVVPESEAAWVFKIAHNVCASSKLAWLRRRRVESPRDLDELHVARLEPDVDMTGLGDALAAMPARLREAFLLREWQGLSYAEIAERLDTSRSAVETLIFRARRHLAAELRKAQQALALGPLGAWLRGFFTGGSGVLRGAGVVALATGVIAATTTAPAAKRTPARARPQQLGARAGASPSPDAARTPHVRTAIVKTPVAAAPEATLVPAEPAEAAAAPTASGGATSAPAATTTTTAAPAVIPPSTPTATPPAVAAAPAVTVPAVAVPAATAPAVTVPAVTVPLPAVTLPVVTVPGLTTPVVTTPTVTVSSPLP